jgi:hypothetical protein
VTPRERSDLLYIFGAVAIAVLLGLAVYLFWPV